MTLRDVRPEAELPALAARPAKGLPQYSGTWRHRTKEGLIEVLVRSNAVVAGGVHARLALLEDLTERLTLEAQLRQSQKMEAVGQLAGGRGARLQQPSDGDLQLLRSVTGRYPKW